MNKGQLELARIGVEYLYNPQSIAVIFSAGFAEVDEEGPARQKEIRVLERAHGIRLLGPNCLGLLNLTNNNMASFAHIFASVGNEADTEVADCIEYLSPQPELSGQRAVNREALIDVILKVSRLATPNS